MTVNEIYQSGLKLLENNNIENSKFEAQSLLQKAFSLDRVGFIIHKTDKADENCSHNFLKFIEKRISGEPLQYILGEWSFMGFDFKVGRGVLIPRDDTEVVVNLCIDFLENRTDKKTVDSHFRALPIWLTSVRAAVQLPLHLIKFRVQKLRQLKLTKPLFHISKLM